MKDDNFSAAETAAIDFQPWEEGVWQPPSNQEWIDAINPHLTMVRFAHAVVTKSKTDLVDTIVKIDAEDEGTLYTFLDNISVSADWFKAYSELLNSATARIIIAASVAVENNLGSTKQKPNSI